MLFEFVIRLVVRHVNGHRWMIARSFMYKEKALENYIIGEFGQTFIYCKENHFNITNSNILIIRRTRSVLND